MPKIFYHSLSLSNQVSPPLMCTLLDQVPEPKETQDCSIQPYSAGPAELSVTVVDSVMACLESSSAATDNVPANMKQRKDQCEGSATLDVSTDVQGSTVSPPSSALTVAPLTPTPLPSSAPSPPSVSGRFTNEH